MAAQRRRTQERREPPERDPAPSEEDAGDERPGARRRADADASRPRRGEGARHPAPKRGAKGASDPAHKPPHRKRRAGGDTGAGGSGRLRRIAYWGAVLAIWAAIAVAGTFVWVASTLPPIQALEIPKRPPSIQIVGATGRLLVTRGDTAGMPIALGDLPAYVPKAFLAIEDRRFHSHHGIDPVGLMRAALANALRRGVAQGGSTITQQLAKNLFLTQERTIVRKLQEVVLALWLERNFSKTEILELYLNRVYFGSGAYGIEAAAQRYFGKSARRMTLADAALLAGLVKSPSRLAPNRNFDAAERRAQLVLAAMTETGMIGDNAAKVAMANPPHIIKQSAGGSINYAADWVMDAVNDLVGRVDEDIVVETTLDPLLQAAAEKALADELAHKGERFHVEQGALVAMSTDGAVRALVGGRNYGESQFNRAVSARRQPGSAFKPFVYLTALERGLTPDTVREDKPINLKGWKPENYTREYFGRVTLTQALANSLNTVSVRLTTEFGPTAVAKTAYRLGIASRLDPNPSLALGTSEVSLLELVSAFAPFSNGGMAIVPHVVVRVRTLDGKLLYGGPPAPVGRVIDLRYVAMMNAMLRETLLTGTARRADLPGWAAAGKTGTSQDFRDAWFVGYTGHLVAGVWMGNDDNSPTRKATGGGLPVEVWSRFMKAAHQSIPVADLPTAPREGVFARILPPSDAPVPRAAARENIRPEADRGLDGWFLQRLFGGR